MKKKKLWLLLAVLLYALALIFSLSHNGISLKPGYVPQHIGHTLDSLTKKEKP
jgi:hypothetical protein